MQTSFWEQAADPFKRLFWWGQISMLRACPPLAGVVANESLGAGHSLKVWVITLLRLAARMPRVAAQHVSDKKNKRVVFSRVSFIVTTRCTLNCDKCISRLYDRKDRSDSPTQELLGDIEKLLAGVDYIYAILLFGGEPFLHPDLDLVMRACAVSEKVGSINIITNGTLIPDAKTLAALRETRASVKISNYGPALQPNVEKLKRVLAANGIAYTHESAAFWRDLGAYGQLKEGASKRRFSICHQQLCSICHDGRLHLCAESAMLMDEGIIPDSPEDYINLRTASPAQFREKRRVLLKKRVITACSYCLGTTYIAPRIPVAVQREGERKDASLRET